jgi:hypothetical protein
MPKCVYEAEALSPRKNLVPQQIGETWYKSNQNPWDAGALLPATLWANNTPFLTKAEYQALQPVSEV